MKLAKAGVPAPDLHNMMKEMAGEDLPWKERLASGVAYPAGDDVLEVAQQAYMDFFSANALYPTIFPSVARFEREVVEMTADLLHGDQAVGAISSGGSESILLGVKSARDRARELRPDVTAPEMVVPESAHPAFWKAAHYFDLKLVATPLNQEGVVDVPAFLAAVTDDTVLMVGSAPSGALGMIDPIPDMAALAEDRDISFHVDACVGGYFLPFVEKLGHPITTWDFRVPGVTTISADLHKFGYTAKGASAIMSRDPDIYRHQVFDFGPPRRSKGWYVTPTMAGTRPGGAIAAAWAVMNYLGQDGYLRLVDGTMRYIKRFQKGINDIEGVFVLGEPVMSVFDYTSTTLDILAVAAAMGDRGWLVSKSSYPFTSIHFMQSPGHEPYVDAYLRDLEDVVELVVSGAMTARGPEDFVRFTEPKLVLHTDEIDQENRRRRVREVVKVA